MVGGQSPDSCSLISEVRSEGLFRRGLLSKIGVRESRVDASDVSMW